MPNVQPGLESVDHELFELLSSHAAMALHLTALHAAANVSMEVA